MAETPVDMGMVSAPPAPAAPAPQQSAPERPSFAEQRLAQDQAAPPFAARESAPANPRSRGHSPARDTYERISQAQDQAPGEAPPAPAADQQQPPAAAEKIKVGKYETTEGELAAMLERQSRDDLRAATVPTTPQDYKLAIPDGMKLPGDVDFRFDEANNKAAFDAARAWAHNKGMSQSDFSEMLGLYASQEAQQHAALAERSRQEIAKVGINGPQRVDAVGKWITGMVGEADAKPIRATLVTDSHLRFYETIMYKLQSQGGASFSQAHRAAPDNDKIPGFEKMSFAQQRQAQDQYAARRGGHGR
jgi:hypothetical protein